jgi:hypothetical protein
MFVPATYMGRVSIEGQPAPDDVVIKAFVDGIEWSTTRTKDGKYRIQVPCDYRMKPPCFAPGPMVFEVDGVIADQSVGWIHRIVDLDLTVGEAASTPQPSPSWMQPTPSTEATPNEPPSDGRALAAPAEDEMPGAYPEEPQATDSPQALSTLERVTPVPPIERVRVPPESWYYEGSAVPSAGAHGSASHTSWPWLPFMVAGSVFGAAALVALTAGAWYARRRWVG